MAATAPIDWHWYRTTPGSVWGRGGGPASRLLVTVRADTAEADHEAAGGVLFAVPASGSGGGFSVVARPRRGTGWPPARFVPLPPLGAGFDAGSPLALRWSPRTGHTRVRVAVPPPPGSLAAEREFYHAANRGECALPADWEQTGRELLVTPIAPDGGRGPTEVVRLQSVSTSLGETARAAFPAADAAQFELLPADVLADMLGLVADPGSWSRAVRATNSAADPLAEYLRRPNDFHKLCREPGLAEVVLRWGWPGGRLTAAGAVLHAWEREGAGSGDPAAVDRFSRRLAEAADDELTDWLRVVGYGLSPERAREFRLDRGWPLDPLPLARAGLALDVIRSHPLELLAAGLSPTLPPAALDALRLERAAAAAGASLEAVERAAAARWETVRSLAGRAMQLAEGDGDRPALHGLAAALTSERLREAADLMRSLRRRPPPDGSAGSPADPVFGFEADWAEERERARREQAARSRRVAGWCLHLFGRRALPTWVNGDDGNPETAAAAWADLAPQVLALPDPDGWLDPVAAAEVEAGLRAAAAEAAAGSCEPLTRAVQEMWAAARRIALWLNHDRAEAALQSALPLLAGKVRSDPARRRAGELLARPPAGFAAAAGVAGELGRLMREEQTWEEACRRAASAGVLELAVAAAGIDATAAAVARPECGAAVERERERTEAEAAGVSGTVRRIGLTCPPLPPLPRLRFDPPLVVHPAEFRRMEELLAVTAVLEQDRSAVAAGRNQLRAERRRLCELVRPQAGDGPMFDRLLAAGAWDELVAGFQALAGLAERAGALDRLLRAGGLAPGLSELLRLPQVVEWADASYRRLCRSLQTMAAALGHLDHPFISPAEVVEACELFPTPTHPGPPPDRVRALGDGLRAQLVHLARQARAALPAGDVPRVTWPDDLPAFLTWVRDMMPSDPAAAVLAQLGLR